MPKHIGQPAIGAVVAEGKFLVIEAEQMPANERRPIRFRRGLELFRRQLRVDEEELPARCEGYRAAWRR